MPRKKTMPRKKRPEVIEDAALDEASGGLPAIQKVCDAANQSSSSAVGPHVKVFSGQTLAE